VHQSVDLFLRALEVVDGKGVGRYAADTKAETDLQHLPQYAVSGHFHIKPRKATHPPESDKAVRVSMSHLHLVCASIPAVAVHDEGDMTRDGACCEDTQERVLRLGCCIQDERADVLADGRD